MSVYFKKDQINPLYPFSDKCLNNFKAVLTMHGTKWEALKDKTVSREVSGGNLAFGGMILREC